MFKNTFSFHYKSSFCSRDITFLFWFFRYVEKSLDKKAMFNFKIDDSQQIVLIPILPNISSNTGNQGMEFGQ